MENPLNKQSEKACMCFKMRHVRTRDFKYGICYVGQKIPFLTRIANSIKVRLHTIEFCKSEILILLNDLNNNI